MILMLLEYWRNIVDLRSFGHLMTGHVSLLFKGQL